MSPLKIISMVIMTAIILYLGMNILVPSDDEESLGNVQVSNTIS